MRPPHSCRHAPQTFRGPTGAPPKVTAAEFACPPPHTHGGTPLARFEPILAPPKVPVAEHASPAFISAHPSRVSRPHRSSAEGHSG
eukprot:2760208-Pyramimonas_sp.AAC.1